MNTLQITLTVPYAGQDRTITGNPAAIALAAEIVGRGLPACDDKPADNDNPIMMGMGNGQGNDFITGSYELVTAIQTVMLA